MALESTKRAEGFLAPWVIKNKTFFFFFTGCRSCWENAGAENTFVGRVLAFRSGGPRSKGRGKERLGRRGVRKQRNHENRVVPREASGSECADHSCSLSYIAYSPGTLKQGNACFGSPWPKL